MSDENPFEPTALSKEPKPGSADTLFCPFCNHEFFHEGLQVVTCPECSGTFDQSAAGTGEWKRLGVIANCLLGLAAVSAVLNFLFILTGLGEGFRFIALGISTITVLPTLFFGAQSMKCGRRYELATVACVVAALPCGPSCVLGIPVGVWGLILLSDPKIKSSFR